MREGSASATEPWELSVWIVGDKGYGGFIKAGERFVADTTIPVSVEPVPMDSGSDKFQAAASSGKGPDIWCWPHDRLGGWVQSGLLAPITPDSPSGEWKTCFNPVSSQP